MTKLSEFVGQNTFRVSEDGYIRMSEGELSDLPLLHLLSGLDEDRVEWIYRSAMPPMLCGYTEWLSNATPVITVGWDWRLEGDRGASRYLVDGWPRTNIMLINADTRRDLGAETTARGLVARIERLDWAREVAEHVGRMGIWRDACERPG